MTTKHPEILESINDESDIRIEIEPVSLFSDGEVRGMLGARLYVRRETPSGRPKWVEVFGPLLATTDEDGTTRDDLSAAELLTCIARVFETRVGVP